MLAPLCLLALVRDAPAQRLPGGFDDVPVASDLVKPTSMAFAPDGRLFVTEQEGAVRLLKDGAPPALFLAVATDASRERGLLGIAFPPDFPRTPHVYVYYTQPGRPLNRLSRFSLSRSSPDIADPASETVLLDDIPSAHFHNGGALHFAADGTLFVAVGDAEVPESAASLQALSGKLLRVDRDGRAPRDNPFAGNPAARPEVWAYGLRNPFTFAIERGSGRIFINDVSVKGAEEVDEGVAGYDYGWPGCQGACGGGAGEPLHVYKHGGGSCAIAGGTFAGGLAFPPEFARRYFFADFCGGWIRSLEPDGTLDEFAADLPRGIVDLDVGPDGHLYYLSYNLGQVRRVEFVGAGNRRPVAAASADPSTGPPPLQVVLSAQQSHDPDGEALTYAWDFGDATAGGSGPVIAHSYKAKGAYTARVTVTDGAGARATAAARIQVGTPPSARIATPPPGATFAPGSVIAFAGDAVDPESGPLPADALAWTVVLHHHAENAPDHHVHPFLGPVTGAGGSFEVPKTLHDDDMFFRIHLAAVDGDRLVHEVSRDVVRAPAAGARP